VPSTVNGRKDAREVVLEEDKLAEPQRVTLGLRPSRTHRLVVRLALRRVVHHPKDDGLDAKASSCGEESLDAHVQDLRDPIWAPSFYSLGQGCRDGVGRVRYADGVWVCHVC